MLRYKNKDFGQDGIVWWLGTNRGKKKAEYQNPYDAKIVGLTPSSLHGGTSWIREGERDRKSTRMLLTR